MRIQQHRILAKKLPIFYGSDLPEFTAYYKEKQLWRLAEVLEELGGLLTGESFGTELDIQNGLADGGVLDITPGEMPLSGYYALYESCGWSSRRWERSAQYRFTLRARRISTHCRWATVMFQPENVVGRAFFSSDFRGESPIGLFLCLNDG